MYRQAIIKSLSVAELYREILEMFRSKLIFLSSGQGSFVTYRILSKAEVKVCDSSCAAGLIPLEGEVS